MKCDHCKQAEATVHLAQSVNGTVSKIHLCEACSVKKGLNIKHSISVTDVLLGLDQLVHEDAARPGVEAATLLCPACGISLAEYKKRGRLGCAVCYDAFRNEIHAFIRAVHHSEQHVGKRPARETGETPPPHDPEDHAALEKELRAAIEREDYETAARLRDRLAQHEQETAGDERRRNME